MRMVAPIPTLSVRTDWAGAGVLNEHLQAGPPPPLAHREHREQTCSFSRGKGRPFGPKH